MSYVMTEEERMAFLAGVHVGVVSVAQAERGPLTVPVWYVYEAGGQVRLVTELSSRKAQLIEKAGRFSLCAQEEALPYRYVSVEGALASVEPADMERDVRPLYHRYLGREEGDAYLEKTHGGGDIGDTVVISMYPETWYSADFGKENNDG